LLLLIALVPFFPPAREGAAVEPSREAGIVLVRRDADRGDEYVVEESADPPMDGKSPEPMVNTVDNATESPPLDLQLPGAGTPEFSSDVAASPLHNDEGDGRGSRALLAGKARVSVFGAEGEGTSFAFVFDRSASMGNFGGLPLRSARRELMAALDSLDKRHRFQIVFFHDEVSWMDPDRRLMFADERQKRLADRYVRSVVASSGTNHRLALTEAMKIGADVTFFLTDGEGPHLTPELAADVQRWNRHSTVLHVIQFSGAATDGPNELLQQLAAENGGEFRFVPVAALGE
jgi:hypothetical protein